MPQPKWTLSTLMCAVLLPVAYKPLFWLDFPALYTMLSSKEGFEILSASQNADAAVRIPAVIHQVWLSPENASTPQKWHAAMQSCKKVNPGYRHMLWTNKNATSLINKCCPELQATYNSYKHAIQKADAARYAALLEYGGIYIDIDVECVQPFDGVRYNTLVIAQETAGEQGWPMMFSNHFLAAEPNNSFVSRMVKALPAWSNNLYFKYPTVFASTGPWFLTAQVYLHADRAVAKILPSAMQNPPPAGQPRPLFVHHSDYSWNTKVLRNGFKVLLDSALLRACAAVTLIGVASYTLAHRAV